MSLLQRGQMIVFEGDSLTNRRGGPSLDTWPFLRLMRWNGSWADQAAELLFAWRPELELRFHNAAVGGSSCRELTERLERSVLPHKPDWVFLTLGANDAARGIPVKEFEQTLSAYARRLKEACGARLGFVSGFHPIPRKLESGIESKMKVPPYYRKLQAVAARHNGLYLNVGRRLYEKAAVLRKQSTHHTIFSDGSHFNELGDLIIAGEVLRELGVIK